MYSAESTRVKLRCEFFFGTDALAWLYESFNTGSSDRNHDVIRLDVVTRPS